MSKQKDEWRRVIVPEQWASLPELKNEFTPDEIERLRIHLKVHQNQLASLMHVSTASINRIMRGHSSLTDKYKCIVLGLVWYLCVERLDTGEPRYRPYRVRKEMERCYGEGYFALIFRLVEMAINHHRTEEALRP